MGNRAKLWTQLAPKLNELSGEDAMFNDAVRPKSMHQISLSI